MGSEVRLVLTHARSHVALLAGGLAVPMVPRVSVPPMSKHMQPLVLSSTSVAPQGSGMRSRELSSPKGLNSPARFSTSIFLFFSFIYVC